MNAELSIIILNYNTKKLTLAAIASIEKNYPHQIKSGEFQVIVADNASPDDSLTAFTEYKKNTSIKNYIVCDNKENVGFAKGNNLAVQHATGAFVLFLNPDTIVPEKTLTYLIDFLQNHPDVGVVSCKIVHPDGSLDPNCLRGFPTPWNSFCHFSGIGKLFPKSKLFSGYLQSGWRDSNKTQEVEAVEGAFMMLPKNVGVQIGWMDEDYFFYGEDIQFCYNIYRAGYKIYYVPDVTITHYGGAASGIKKQSHHITTADLEIKKSVQSHRFNAMKIFYKKNYSQKYPSFFNALVYTGIDFLYKRKGGHYI